MHAIEPCVCTYTSLHRFQRERAVEAPPGVPYSQGIYNPSASRFAARYTCRQTHARKNRGATRKRCPRVVEMTLLLAIATHEPLDLDGSHTVRPPPNRTRRCLQRPTLLPSADSKLHRPQRWLREFLLPEAFLFSFLWATRTSYPVERDTTSSLEIRHTATYTHAARAKSKCSGADLPRIVLPRGICFAPA